MEGDIPLSNDTIKSITIPKIDIVRIYIKSVPKKYWRRFYYIPPSEGLGEVNHK